MYPPSRDISRATGISLSNDGKLNSCGALHLTHSTMRGSVFAIGSVQSEEYEDAIDPVLPSWVFDSVCIEDVYQQAVDVDCGLFVLGVITHSEMLLEAGFLLIVDVITEQFH